VRNNNKIKGGRFPGNRDLEPRRDLPGGKQPVRPTPALLSAVTLALALGAAQASLAQAIPGPAQAGRIPEDLRPPMPPPVTPQAQIKTAPASRAPAFQGEFTLRQVDVEGVTVYRPEAIQALYGAYIGKSVGADSLDEIQQAITVKYRQDGYILSQARLMSVDPATGVARFRVLEGYVDQVKLDPAAYDSGDKGGLLRSIVRRIAHACHDGDQPADGRPCPINRAELERYLLLANDLPGVKVSAVVQPSTDMTGAADVVITVVEKPVDASVVIDNRGSLYVGPVRFQQSVAANNLLGLYDRTELDVAESVPFNELFLVTGTEEIPLTSDGLRLALTVNHSRARPGDALRPLDLRDTDDSGDLALSYAWIRSRAENLLFHIDFTVRNSTTNQFDNLLFNDKVRALTFGLSYDLADRWQGINQARVELTQGIPIFGSTPQSSTFSSHFRAPPDFTKIDVELSRLQRIAPEWNVLTAVSGQYSGNPLLAAEQFGFGGERFGRAYDDSELLGDSGIAGKVELQYTPGWAPGLFRWSDELKGFQLYAFYDIGRMWVDNAPNPPPPHLSAASAGGGFRYSITDYLSGYLEVAKPLTRNVLALAADRQDARAPRVFFSVAAKY
jgi:hemolysin activation/secretion protein